MRQICQASTEEAQGFKQQDKGEDNWDLFVTKWEGGGRCNHIRFINFDHSSKAVKC